MSTLGLVAAYILGGLTFFPAILLLAYISHTLHGFLNNAQSPNELLAALGDDTSTVTKTTTLSSYKVGWLRVSRDEQRLPPPDASISDMVRSYITANNKEAQENKKSSIYFAVLKHHTLYLYDSERQLDCQGVIQVDQHKVTMHPPGLKDPELFTRPHLIKLTHMQHNDQHYYINCNRCIDKEDWFLALRHAAYNNTITTHDVDQQIALRHLINTIHSNEHHFQTQWFNAMLGRIFCGVYKTDNIRAFLYNKLISKLDKINARRPPFLGEITVRSVHPGHAQPYITQPRLLSLTPTGELTAEAYMQYEGGIRFEIETVLQWRYSDHLPPLKIDLVLAITLRSLHGRFLLKIKEPPTNRFWYGFYELPKMEWGVEPLVWERRVGYSVVVKAIQNKIDELVMENIVLPNMDDITFFPTENADGGIFLPTPKTTTSSSSTTSLEDKDNKPKLRRAATTKESVTITPPSPRSPKQRPVMSGSVSEGTRQQQRTGSLIGNILKHKTSFEALSTSPLATSSPSTMALLSSSSSTTSSIASSTSSSSHYQHHHPPTAIHSESDLSENIRLRKSASLARLKSKSMASTAVSQINVSPTMHHDFIDSKKITTTSSNSSSETATAAMIKSSQSVVSIAS
ncbi:hypothetical protein K492DRAFT_173080 [Lichtheimia hyalospora FSU 10163]|nr:hypothetical protein K492DRAFT_173080 [Lichtheimia hyalospora FSU 10163]